MQNDLTQTAATRPRFSWRALTSILAASSFSILVFSGVILFVSPPGRIANWTNWAILGLRKQEWTSLHLWFSVLFLLVAIAHVYLNWRPMVNYFKDRMTRRVGFRWEWLLALLICGGVYGGTRAGVPPFSTLLALNEQVKESWDKKEERAPIPHAELLTLSELAQKAGIDMSVATNRLQAQGIVGYSPEAVVQQLAAANERSAQQIYEVLVSSTGARRGHEEGQARGGGSKGGGKAGGGPGWQTLAQYCAARGLDLSEASARLQAKGVKFSADQTMREIAVNNGYERPYELINILEAGKH